MTSTRKKDWKMFAFGGISSSIATLTSNPFDVIKIRLQLQGEKGNTFAYKHTFDALIKISKNEGPKVLLNGIQPAILRQFFYGSLRFGIYQGLKNDKQQDSYFKKLGFSFFSGSFAGLLCNPFDMLKVRLQGNPQWQSTYKKHIFGSFKQMYIEKGMRGMYVGCIPTSLRAGLVASAEIASYDQIKQIIGDHNKDILSNGLVGIISGFLGAFVSNPIDVVKSRILNQSITDPLYKNSLDCFIKTVKNEGVFSLYKGLVPTCVRNIPQVVTTFIVLEELNRLFNS